MAGSEPAPDAPLGAAGPAAALGLACFAVFLACAARTVQGADAGEFMTVAAIGGVPHPPGYPLQTWLVQAAYLLLPWGGVPWRASLVSAAQVGVAVGLLADAGARLARSRAPGLVAAALFAGSLTVFRYATVAEVFGGVALTAAAVLWVAARVAGGWRGPAAGAALGLAVASGVAGHHTVVLLAPLATWTALVSLPRPLTPARVASCWGVLALTLALGFAAYLPFLGVREGWIWGECARLDGLIEHFLRREYGTFSLSAAPSAVRWHDHLREFGERLVVDSTGAVVALALVGAGVALRAARRGFWAALALAWLLSGPAFILAVNLPSDHMGQVLARRFHVLPAAVAVPFVALGVAWLLRVTRARRLVLAGLALVCVALGARAAARSGHQHATLLDAFLREGLLRLPPGAVVVHAADEVLFGMLYLQRVEGVRPDVIAIDSNLLPAAWYRREIARQHPGAAAWIAGLPRHPPDLYAALVAQRPTWLTVASWFRPAEVAGLPGLTPDAGWLRAHPAGTPPPTPDEVAAGLDAAVARLRLTPPDGREEAAWLDSRDAWVPDQLAYSYLIVAEALARGGQGTAAEAIAARGLALAPWVEREQGEAGGR